MAFIRSKIGLLVVVVMIVGCGSPGPFDYVKVKGKVTYEDGSTIPFPSGTQLVFKSETPPIDEMTHPRPGITILNADGTFSVITSYKYNDGLTPGKHKVLLTAMKAGDKLPIPPEYGSIVTTPLEIDTSDSPLEIKIPKPKETEK